MADYFEVPRLVSGSDNNQLFYSVGITLFYYDNYQAYRLAYKSHNEQYIRVGIVKHRPEVYDFVFYSHHPIWIDGMDLRLVNSYLTTVGQLTNMMRPVSDFISGYEGYYGVIPFSKDRLTFVGITWFNSIEECLTTLAIGESPLPSDGVVVTCIGTPVTPSNNGVIVTCIGTLIDPNMQGGTSEPGGGHGTFNDYSDPIPIPPLPTISAADCGLVTLFRPTKEELQSLGSYLWTNITDFIENLNKLFMNPMDYLIALNIFPCVPEVGAERAIHIGSFTTSISMSPVLSQWYQHNCGTITISEYWGSALDYAPNTKVSLFLPFIGSVQLNTDEVMGKRISIVYRIDLLSGQCVAMVTIGESPTQVGAVYYQYTGECAVSVPLTGADWSRIYSAAIGALGVAITGVVSAGTIATSAGGATAALAGARASEAMSMAGQNFAMLNDTSKGIKGVQEMRNRMLEAAEVASNAARQAATAPNKRGKAIMASRIANTINNTVGQVVSGKGHISHSGNISGSAGMLGVKVPYVVLEYPNQSLADNYKHFVGYPSNMSGKLSDFTGYTECEQIVPVGFTGTDDELAELLDALKGGVYL